MVSQAYIADEESTIDLEVAGRMMLQDILEMDEPQRTHYIRAWVDYGQVADDGGNVKLRTPDGSRMEIPFGKRGKKMLFPYSGKSVSRLAALTILREYGEFGMYRGVDLSTGMPRDAWETIQIREPEIAKIYAKHTFNFNENYLEQVPLGSLEDEEEDSQEE